MVPTTQNQLEELEQKLAKALADVELWRNGYEQSEAENKRLSALVEKGTSAADGKAIVLLRSLAAHVAGRDGMLQQSRIFCTKCEGAGRCMLREVYEFLGE